MMTREEIKQIVEQLCFEYQPKLEYRQALRALADFYPESVNSLRVCDAIQKNASGEACSQFMCTFRISMNRRLAKSGLKVMANKWGYWLRYDAESSS